MKLRSRKRRRGPCCPAEGVALKRLPDDSYKAKDNTKWHSEPNPIMPPIMKIMCDHSVNSVDFKGNMASMASKRKCVTCPDSFCYICGALTAPKQRRNISEFVKRAYFCYFKVKLGDQDKPWAPHKVCHSREENLRQWTKGKDKITFGIPMIWREPRDHVTDCYFCVTLVAGFTSKTRHLITYPSLDSAIRPVPHSDVESDSECDTRSQRSQQTEMT
ncbi:uncharacterized protein LOC143033819 [Oratosquilla oratoria]|uniref:uncharacterized protein LOC143033819 n=1 Tax=Oratosquilla oratoria TaxID=337810 RepID=UPI003F766520